MPDRQLVLGDNRRRLAAGIEDHIRLMSSLKGADSVDGWVRTGRTG